MLGVLLLAAAGPGARLELWSWQSGLQLLRWAAYVGIGAVLVSLPALVLRRRRWMAFAGLVLGLIAAGVPFELQRRAREAPRTNDVSTGGAIAPLVLQASPAQAFDRARAAARDMGWQIVSADPAAGRIEAVATTFWFGFKDDVTVRVTPQDGQARIDVRSRSRVGRGDAGANAARIRRYLEKLGDVN